jgi:translocator protein
MSRALKLNHLAIPYLALLAFLFGGILSADGLAWYGTLTLPTWAPTEGLIAFIWAVIYICLSAAALRVWNDERRDHHFRGVILLLVLSLAANLSWAVLFFHLHLFAESFSAALALAAFLGIAMVLLLKRDPRAALLIAPMFAWVAFAAYFIHTLGLLNSA